MVKESTGPDFFNHYLLLSCAYRILLKNISQEKIVMANQILNKFVEEFPNIYGQNSVTHNVHSL